MLLISFNEIIAASLFFVWVVFLTKVLSKKIYEWMEIRGIKYEVAVYYNRKVVHVLGGGLCALIVPFTFTSPILPFVFAMTFAILIYHSLRSGRTMCWFQIESNHYEISFIIMWGIIISLGWIVSGGNFWFGVLPTLFMSIGDAITGIVRNRLHKKRSKSWWGNLAMGVFSTIIGATMGIAGIIAGAAASFTEHFEFKLIDDNVSVPSVSFLILLFIQIYLPELLSF